MGESGSPITSGNATVIIPDGHKQENVEFALLLESGQKSSIAYYLTRSLVIAREIVYFQYFFETIECNTMQSECIKSHLSLY